MSAQAQRQGTLTGSLAKANPPHAPANGRLKASSLRRRWCAVHASIQFQRIVIPRFGVVDILGIVELVKLV